MFLKKFFGKKKRGKAVSVVIKCASYSRLALVACELNSHVPNYGFNTSYLDVYFHAELTSTLEKYSEGFFKIYLILFR